MKFLFRKLFCEFFILACALFLAAPAPASAQPILNVSYGTNVQFDTNQDSVLNPGETEEFTVSIQNTGDSPALDVDVTATLDPNLTFIPGSVQIEPFAVRDSLNIVEDAIPNTVSGNLLANDIGRDPGETLRVTKVNGSTTPGTVATNFGSVTWDASGDVTYTVDNANNAVDGLMDFDILIDAIPYEMTDGTGIINGDTLEVFIQGVSDG